MPRMLLRKFGAYFNTLFVGTFSEAGAREEPYQRAFVFDGRMLIEIEAVAAAKG